MRVRYLSKTTSIQSNGDGSASLVFPRFRAPIVSLFNLRRTYQRISPFSGDKSRRGLVVGGKKARVSY